jgi:hypothetical protein
VGILSQLFLMIVVFIAVIMAFMPVPPAANEGTSMASMRISQSAI